MNKAASTAPVIGISGHGYSKSILAMVGAIEAAGASAKVLDDHGKRKAKSDFKKIDAIIFMGNDFDIDPASYIERYPDGHPRKRIHPETKSELSTPEGRARAEYEDQLMKIALEKRLPMLAICGGMQRLNVVCGGTLHQHMPDIIGDDRMHQSKQGIAPHIPVVPIVIPRGTRLAIIASDIKMSFVKSSHDCPTVIMENSLRHQSIDILGKGLRVGSMSDVIRKPDGTSDYIIQSIEADPGGPYRHQFLLAVQWHPEYGASPIGERIIRHLITAAKEFYDGRKKP